MNDLESKFIHKLYIDLAARLMRYARIALGDEYLAEEAVHDTFLAACGKVGVLMEHPNPQAWMVAALRTTFRKYLSQRAHDAELLNRIAAAAPDDSSADEDDPDVLYSDLLENEDYKLLRSFAEDGSTISEFAAKLGIPPDTCSKRIQRARKRLRGRFEDI